MEIEIGGLRVGLRADSEETLDRIATLLRHHIRPANSTSPVRSNFSVRAPRGRLHRQNGELYIAGRVAARSKRFDDLCHALVGHLSGIAEGTNPSTEATKVEGTRVYVGNERAVLVRSPRPCRTDPPSPEVGEVHVWDPQVDAAAGAVILPGRLEDVAWHEAGVTPPSTGSGGAVPLVGLVVPPDAMGFPDAPALWLDSRGDLDRWGLVISNLHSDARVLTASTPLQVAAAVRRLMSDGAH
jgi:hypothetical protein